MHHVILTGMTIALTMLSTCSAGVSFRPLSTQRVSSWLQGLRWEPGTQWKQEWAGENVWLLRPLEECLGGQESTRLCLCGVRRLSRCFWCCERTGWKVSPDFSVITYVLFIVMWLNLSWSWHALSCSGTCVACGCVWSYPQGRNAQGAVFLLHLGTDARVTTSGDAVLRPDEGKHSLLPSSFQVTLLFYSQSHLLMCTSEYENI